MSETEILEFLLAFNAVYYCAVFGISVGVVNGLFSFFSNRSDDRFRVDQLEIENRNLRDLLQDVTVPAD